MSSLIQGCTCPSIEDFIGDTVPLELGPAYQFYKDEKSISRKYEPRSHVPQFIIPDCCSELELESFQYLRTFHICIVVFMILFVLLLILLVAINKNRQPIKFRQADHLVIHLLVQCLPFLLLATVVSSDSSAVCSMAEFAIWCLTPVTMMYYILKTIQLDFIYRWSFAKLRGDHKASKWFFQNKWIMSSKLYYWAVTFGIVFGSLVIAGSHGESPVYDKGDSVFGSIRCYWWDIPDAYTVPFYPSAFCPCYDFIFAGDKSQEAECTSAFVSICVNSSSVIPPLSNSETMELCSSCIQSDSSSAKATCQNLITTWFQSGACGFPQEMPNLRTCRSCFYADNGLFIGWMCYALFLLAIEMGLSIKVRGMSDQLFIRTEIMFGFCTILPAIIIFIAVRQSYSVNDQLYDAFGTYAFAAAILLILYTALVTLSGLVPVVLCYYWRYLDEKDSVAEVERRTTLYSMDLNYKDVIFAQLAEIWAFLQWSARKIPVDIAESYHSLLEKIVTKTESEVGLVSDANIDTSNSGGNVKRVSVARHRSSAHSHSIECLIAAVSENSNISQTNYIGIMTEFLVGSKSAAEKSPSSALSGQELSFALSNDEAGPVYASFSWREFTIENYFFLKAVLKVCQQCAQILSSHTLADVRGSKNSLSLNSIHQSNAESSNIATIVEDAVEIQAEWANMAERSVEDNLKWIIDHFILTGSSWEINIPSKTRTDLLSSFAKITSGSENGLRPESSVDNPITVNERSSNYAEPNRLTSDSRKIAARVVHQQYIKCLLPAVVEVRLLVIRDSWARFKNSKGYAMDFKPIYDAKHNEELIWRELAVNIIDEVSAESKL